MEDYNVNSNDAKSKKSTRGYQIIIILLVVVLIGVSFILFRWARQERSDKETLTLQYENLRTDYGNLEVENETINASLAKDRMRLDSLYDKLQGERTLNRATVRKYEQELGTMRAIMRRYVHQIDSLNQLNRELTAENVNIRQQATTERRRADAAEERASELSRKVQTGAIVKARDIMLLALNSNDRPVPRASRAERLRVDFILAANEIATPGLRNVYARIAGPDGYVLAGDTESLFDFEGDKITYSATREIDYRNEDLAVGLYYNGAGIVSGTYTVEVYMDGAKIGSGEAILK